MLVGGRIQGLETAVRCHMCSPLPPHCYLMSLDILWKNARVARVLPIIKDLTADVHMENSTQLACLLFEDCFVLRTPRGLWNLFNIPVQKQQSRLERIHSHLKMLISSQEQSLAMLLNQKAIHRSMIAAATHEYINALHIESQNHCTAVVFAPIFYIVRDKTERLCRGSCLLMLFFLFFFLTYCSLEPTVRHLRLSLALQERLY